MVSRRCFIVYINRKHEFHARIVAQLQVVGYVAHELILPPEESGKCSIESDIKAKMVGLDLIVVYLSTDVSANACMGVLTKEAEKRGIRLVALWLDDAVAKSFPAPIDSLGDAVTPYTDNLADVFSGKENPWLLPDGHELPKRKIKKHTCG